MAKHSHSLSTQDIQFIIKAARNEPNISVAKLWDIHKNHAGLTDHEAADDIMQVVEKGYITAPTIVTDEGLKWLENS